jgi:hypothetical protein
VISFAFPWGSTCSKQGEAGGPLVGAHAELATLSRGGRRYASGTAFLSHGAVRLSLHAAQRLAHGRYLLTLTLRSRGRTQTTTQTIAIR